VGGNGDGLQLAGFKLLVVSWLDEVGGTIRPGRRLICPLGWQKKGKR